MQVTIATLLAVAIAIPVGICAATRSLPHRALPIGALELKVAVRRELMCAAARLATAPESTVRR